VAGFYINRSKTKIGHNSRLKVNNVGIPWVDAIKIRVKNYTMLIFTVIVVVAEFGENAAERNTSIDQRSPSEVGNFIPLKGTR